jgi:[protein-PII] uridylyltransferase
MSELRERRAAVVADTSLQGRALCRALAAATDACLAERFAEAAGGREAGLALVAVGGHGRGELAPGSDLDLWLLHDHKRDGVAAVADRLWYPVWDAGVKLGHAVRTPKQALSLADGDLDTATAALSARLVAGDPEVAGPVLERAGKGWRSHARRWLPVLARRMAARADEAGEVAFLLEPDLKEGRGGLRDVHSLRWVEAARPVLRPGDDEALTTAEDVLLDVRVALHRTGGRASDVLLLERQDEVAAALGGGDADALVARVAEAARTVAWTADEAWGRVASWLAGPGGRLFRRDRPLGPGLVLREGEVRVESDADVAADGGLVLRAAAAAARVGARLDRSSLDRLASEAPVLDGPWPEGARDALVELLGAGRPAIPVLEALDQRRLLERVLPEWSVVRGRPQRNALHRFTVDRHLCETAVEAAALVGRVPRADLLLVGAWLHDIGKGHPGDHTEVGVDLMTGIAPRMGFGPDDTTTIVDLVRHHLLLPEVATRRDLSDDSVVAGVAEAVGSLPTLELLAALTEADSRATGPGVWSPWKAELLATLVSRAAAALRGEGTPAGVGAFPDAEVRALLEAGATVVRGVDDGLLVVAPDRGAVVSRVAGALALRGLAVLSADAAGTEGMAGLRLRVEVADDPVDWDAVAVDVRRALDGRLALEARLAERSRMTVRRRAAVSALAAPPSVRFDNAASGAWTVIEVRAADRPALLYRVTRALAELDLELGLAKVSTLGAEVVDSFYVRTAAGVKVDDRDHQREVQRALLHALAAP